MNCRIDSPFSFDVVDDLFPLPPLSCMDIPLPQLPSVVSRPAAALKPKNCRRRKPPPVSSDHSNPNEHKKRKIIHRDVERQRRQEMSTLYATLRSLLPFEYLKGKRSICDHMHETVKYIRHMQRQVQELSDKREELKKLSGEDSDAGTAETLSASKRDSVAVRPRGEGVQVVLDTGTQHRLPVSNILEALLAVGLEIVGCISTKINDRFLHTIEAVPDGSLRNIDVSELHHKLTNLEYFPLD
ncbi:transcription factor bHLH118-like [Momordica charantia]|uniref:Transcription factor bHLH118-like n=1 Tax=Momordica charantia TaxID=3673 RepID=A0A6J1DUZ3_MOMCH|nr:transcription factor bHLH118-like [Momordica charantia]